MKKFWMLLLNVIFIGNSSCMIVDIEDVDLTDPAVFGGSRSYSNQERVTTKTLDFSQFVSKKSGAPQHVAQVGSKKKKKYIKKYTQQRLSKRRQERVQNEEYLPEESGALDVEAYAQYEAQLADQDKQEHEIIEEKEEATNFDHPWQDAFNIPERDPIGSEKLNKKLIHEIEDAFKNPTKHKNFLEIKKMMKAGASPDSGFNYIDANIGRYHADLRAQSIIGNAMRYAINFALMESRTQPFGACGNDHCFLAEHVLILTAPQRMGTPVEKLTVLSRVPNLLAQCSDPNAHTMNSKKITEILGTILNRNTSSIEYGNAYKGLSKALKVRFHGKAFLKNIV